MTHFGMRTFLSHQAEQKVFLAAGADDINSVQGSGFVDREIPEAVTGRLDSQWGSIGNISKTNTDCLTMFNVSRDMCCDLPAAGSFRGKVWAHLRDLHRRLRAPWSYDSYGSSSWGQMNDDQICVDSGLIPFFGQTPTDPLKNPYIDPKNPMYVEYTNPYIG